MKIFFAVVGVALLSLASGSVLSDAAKESRKMIDHEIAKPVVRGGIVFKTYCALCHGETGAGEGRAAMLYPKANLAIDVTHSSSFESVIRKGGAETGKSPFMPPWENELSAEQIEDVIAYLNVMFDGVRRGEAVFKANCILCHGIDADGKGRAAKLYDPPPANLTRSDKNEDYMRLIVTLGGAAMGRSQFMPVWGEQLSRQEILDVVKYVRSLKVLE